MPRARSIDDEEIALIKGLLERGLEKTKIQAYFTHPDRPVNFGRITNIEKETYGPDVPAATQEEVDRFLEKWNEKRGVSVEAVVETALDLADLPATDARKLAAMFEIRAKGSWHLVAGETDEIECKRSFSLGSKVLRAVAALANNRGGYILFGVENDSCSVVGLQTSVFKGMDPNKFSQSIRAVMEPMPRIEIGACELGGLTVGALYVHKENDGPVIISKTDQELRQGTIYYRYPGESRAIEPAEFRKLLHARDSKIRQESGSNISRLLNLGPRAAVVDIASSGAEATKIVREGIDEADVLRNFIRQEKVAFPLAYLLRSCSTARSWLPIFYYLKLSGVDLADAIQMVSERETSYVARKRDLLARLRGEKTAITRATGRVAAALEKLKAGDYSGPIDARNASDIALAMTALRSDTLELSKLLHLLRGVIDMVRADKNAKVDIWSSIYKAAAHLDELYFKGPE